MLAAFATTLLFCVSAVSATRTARYFGGIEANFWRLVLAAFLLAIWANTLGSGLNNPAFPTFLFSGLIGFGIGDLALFQALPRLGSRLTSVLVHCLAAPLAAACEYLWLGTRLSGREMICGAIILGGVCIALAPGKSTHQPIPRKTFWIGVFFGALAAFGQGFGAVLSRKAFAVAHAAGLEIDGLSAAYQRILAGVILGGLCLLIAKRDYIIDTLFTMDTLALERSAANSISAKWGKIWPWVIVNACSGPCLGVGCFQWALKTSPAGIVLPIIATMPLMIIPFAMYFEHEKPTKRSLVGGAIAVIGAVLLGMSA